MAPKDVRQAKASRVSAKGKFIGANFWYVLCASQPRPEVVSFVGKCNKAFLLKHLTKAQVIGNLRKEYCHKTDPEKMALRDLANNRELIKRDMNVRATGSEMVFVEVGDESMVHCTILIVPGGSNWDKFRDHLRLKIESAFCNSLLGLVGMGKLKQESEVERNKNLIKDIVLKTQLDSVEEERRKGEQDDEKTLSIYEPQMFTALKLVDRMKDKIGDDQLKKFTDLEVLILVPNRVSIHNQTVERLKMAADGVTNLVGEENAINAAQGQRDGSANLAGKQIKLDPNGPRSLVLKVLKKDAENVLPISVKSSKRQKQFHEFLRRAKDNVNTLHLIIHDECHWAASKDQSAYKFMGFDRGDYQLDHGKALPNLMTVMVSATPFNFFVNVRMKKQHIVNWNKELRNAKLKSDYQGLSHFLKENGKLTEGDLNTDAHSDLSEDLCNNVSPAFVHLILDHAAAACQYVIANSLAKHQLAKGIIKSIERLGFSQTTLVRSKVSEAIQDRKLIVVRLNRAVHDIRQSSIASKFLKKVIEELEIDLQVFVNSPDDKKDSIDLLSWKHRNTLLYNTHRRTGKSMDGEAIKEKNQVTDVEGIPMIMFLIEEGRMGATFPKTFTLFDLRLRYSRKYSLPNFTTLTQDLGRAFGYGKRPDIILSNPTKDLLADVWDPNLNTFDWEKLRESSWLLGYNMKRRREQDKASALENKDMGDTFKKSRHKDVGGFKEDKSSVHEDDDGMDEEGMDMDMDMDKGNMYDDEDGSKEEMKNRVALLQEFLEPDERKPTFLFGLGDESYETRVVLQAEPQIGKTGTIIYLIHCLRDMFGVTGSKSGRLSFTELQKFTSVFYNEYSLERYYKWNTEDDTKDDAQKAMSNYHKELERAREARKQAGILEPAVWAAKCVIMRLNEDERKGSQEGKVEVTVADFGCGKSQQFARYLKEALDIEKDLTRKFQVVLHSFDIIADIDGTDDRDGLIVKAFPNTNCGDAKTFPKEALAKYDFIVSTLALFGSGNSWKETIKVAVAKLVDKTGILLMAEHKNRLPLGVAGVLLKVGFTSPFEDVTEGNFEDFNYLQMKKSKPNGRVLDLPSRMTNATSNNE